MRVHSRISICFSNVSSKGYFVLNRPSTLESHSCNGPGSRRKTNLTRHASVSDGLSMSHVRDVSSRSFVRYASRHSPRRLVSAMATIENPSSMRFVITSSTQSDPCAAVLTRATSTGNCRAEVATAHTTRAKTTATATHKRCLYRPLFIFSAHRKSKIVNRKS